MSSIFKRTGRKGYALKYRDPSTHRVRIRQFSTKGDAQLYGDRIRAALLSVDGLEMDVRFDEHAERWLAASAAAIRQGTVTLYAWALNRYLIPAFGQHYLRDITQKMVRVLVVELRGNLSKAAAQNVVKVLHACMESAVETRVLASNPATIRSRSKLMNLDSTAGEKRGKVKALDADQARAFFVAAESRTPKYALLFRVMALTGLRPGEALGLKVGDLNLAAASIRLERAITPSGRIEQCKTNATGQFDTIDMPAALATDLRTFLDGWPASEWLFPGGGSRPCRRRGVQNAFHRVLVAAGLPDHFTPHCLRHTYATQQLIAGESPYYVMRQLRHADLRMTVSLYGSWLPAGNAAAANRLYERLLGVTELLPSRQS